LDVAVAVLGVGAMVVLALLTVADSDPSGQKLKPKINWLFGVSTLAWAYFVAIYLGTGAKHGLLGYARWYLLAVAVVIIPALLIRAVRLGVFRRKHDPAVEGSAAEVGEAQK